MEGVVDTANNNMDRQLEEALGALFKLIFTLTVKIMKAIWGGIKKLNKWPPWIGVVISCLIAAVGYFCKMQIMALDVPVYIRYLIYFITLAMPFIYLCVLGGFQGKAAEEYERIFKEIGFVGKDGKTPIFCGSRQDGKKQILSFKSLIPLMDWKSTRARLETALDCNILKMESGNSKKVVVLTVLPPDYKIPEKVTWNDSLSSQQNGVIVIGQSALDAISFDLNRLPHVLVAGETGSGKSVILRTMLRQMVLQGSKVFMIDFKGGVEFGKQYERFGEVITERERALEVLIMLVRENEYRLRIFRDMEVKNLAEYNRKTKQNLCRIGVFTDEIAEMLDKKGIPKEQRQIYDAIEGKLSTLARLSRATGINLFLGVQRPDANILTGQIKNNIPVRISGRFADKTASEIVLGNTDAVDLPDIKGRFLYKVGNETIEFQAYYFDDDTMLHDVYVESGSMLTEPETYQPERTQVKNTYTQWQETKEEESQKSKAKKGRFTRKTRTKNKEEKTTSQYNMSDDADAYPDWGMEEELPFPLDDESMDDKDVWSDLDLNY